MTKDIIYHNKPTIDKIDIKAVTDVLESKWLVQGKKTKKFEDIVCKYIGLPKNMAVCMANGTASLYVALKVLGVKNDDEIIIPTYVCTSLLNVVYMAGAIPIIVDVNENDFNISISEIKKNITNKTKAIIVPHMFGVPADIISIKKEFKIPIIEDCAQALGSKIGKKYVGSFGDISIFSFYASKMIATGQGGMLVSKNKNYVKVARDFIDFDLGKGKARGKRVFYPRFNLEITDIQSALGISQFKRLNLFLKNRKKIAKAYQEICIKNGWDFQRSVKNIFFQNNYRFVIKANEKLVKDLKKYLQKNDIGSMIPVENWELLHNFLKLDKNKFTVAERISKQTLSLPIYPDLIKEKKLNKIINILKLYDKKF